MSRQNAVCKALESLLHAATGRAPRGNISEITRRLIINIAYDTTSTKFPSSWHENSVLQNDLDKLSDGIWCVLTSRRAQLELETAGTIPGVSGSTSRIDFACQYASDCFYMTPVGHFRVSNIKECRDLSLAEISDHFEEWLVATAVLFRARYTDNEFLSLEDVYRKITTYCEVFPDTASVEKISERLLAALSAIEAAARIEC